MGGPMAKAKQLIISVEDRPGTVAAAIKSLAAAKINILSILGWNPSGVVQLITDNPRAAKKALEAAHLSCTGFLGSRAVHHLRDHNFHVRVASRHPEKARALFGSNDPQVESIFADVHERPSLARAIAGAAGVVNAVSLYVEKGSATFHSV